MLQRQSEGLHLTHRTDVARLVLGEECVRRLVFPTIVMDATDMVRPLVLQRGGETQAVFLAESEQPALAWAKPGRVILHGYYFTWDTRPRPGLADAVATAADGAKILLDPDAPAALLRTLQASATVEIGAAPPPAPVYAFELATVDVDQRWSADEGDLQAAARRAAGKLEDHRGGAAIGATAPKRFPTLERTLQEAGLDGILLTSPLHVQGLTGFPLEDLKRGSVAALYMRGERDVILLAQSDSVPPLTRRLGRHVTLAAALAAFAQGRIGYEDLHLPAGALHALTDRYGDLVRASETVRRWEDRMAAANVAGFLLASLSAVQGMDYAIEHARHLSETGRGYTEEDLLVVYRNAVQRFAQSLGTACQVRPYFEIIQAGERSAYPAVPSSFPITASTHTIKFDMGIHIVDRRGLIRGCSDLARTCAFGAEASEMNATLDRVLRYELPLAIQPGRTGGDVYASGVASLTRHEAQFRALGFLPDGLTAKGYARDCGHGLGRQTPCTVHFVAGSTATLEDGMVTCAELVWPLGPNVFAVEDAWFLDGAQQVNLTRHTGWVWD